MNNDELRKKRNEELLERMKDPNDALKTGGSTLELFFPKRKIIKKDQKEIVRVWNGKTDSN